DARAVFFGQDSGCGRAARARELGMCKICDFEAQKAKNAGRHKLPKLSEGEFVPFFWTQGQFFSGKIAGAVAQPAQESLECAKSVTLKPKKAAKNYRK
ncbi:MAG: hypothetical protein GY938_07905, partial [Ketobacter sp.]|nr:hypothetical protein [Ketobacter sp.]